MEMAVRELPLAEAAAELGISTEALRMRWRRGRVQGRRDAGRIWIAVDEHAGQQRPGNDRAATEQQFTVVELLRDQVADLRKRLDAADQAQAEMRRLLLASQQQIAELVKRHAELPPPAAATPPETPAEPPPPPPPARSPIPSVEQRPLENPLMMFWWPWLRK